MVTRGLGLIEIAPPPARRSYGRGAPVPWPIEDERDEIILRDDEELLVLL